MALSMLQKMVLDILREPPTRLINFCIASSVAINPTSFNRVHGEIANGRIDVISAGITQSGKLIREDAWFSRDERRIYINEKLAQSAQFGFNTSALILHECVHIYTFLTNPSLSLGDDEAAAFLTQCLYGLMKNPNYRQGVDSINDPKTRQIFSAAIDIIETWGLLSRTTLSLSKQAVSSLYLALSNHDQYRDVYVPMAA